jgi:NAD(P)-dependent dehydrogenase (short-subunit alcohol dehydrogenase family)
MRVDGACVVVTGGGNGIGAALARRFTADGARAVVVADVDEQGLAAVAE